LIDSFKIVLWIIPLIIARRDTYAINICGKYGNKYFRSFQTESGGQDGGLLIL